MMHLNWFISECIFKWHLYRSVNSIKCLLSSYSVLLGCTVNMILQANTAVLSQRWMSAHLVYTRNKALGKRCSLSYSALLLLFFLFAKSDFNRVTDSGVTLKQQLMWPSQNLKQVSHWQLLLSIVTEASDIFPSMKLTSVSRTLDLSSKLLDSTSYPLQPSRITHYPIQSILYFHTEPRSTEMQCVQNS